MRGIQPMPPINLNSTLKPYLAPHLLEIPAMLAAGLVRLRSHTMEDVARDVEHGREREEGSLHFAAHQSGHAKPRDKDLA